jgi:hypothetical protein
MVEKTSALLTNVLMVLLAVLAAFGAARLGMAEVVKTNAIQNVEIKNQKDCVTKLEISQEKKYDKLIVELRDMRDELVGLKALVRSLKIGD